MEAPQEIVQYRGMKPEAAREVLEGLHEGGVNFVSMLPESELLTAQMAILRDGRFQSVPVCNEASGIGVAAGAWLGGKKGAMIMGAAGLEASYFPLLHLCLLQGIPVLLLISYRETGDQNWVMQSHLTGVKPTLENLKIPMVEVKRISEIRKEIKDAAKTCFAWEKPVAVLLEKEVILK